MFLALEILITLLLLKFVFSDSTLKKIFKIFKALHLMKFQDIIYREHTDFSVYVFH